MRWLLGKTWPSCHHCPFGSLPKPLISFKQKQSAQFSSYVPPPAMDPHSVAPRSPDSRPPTGWNVWKPALLKPAHSSLKVASLLALFCTKQKAASLVSGPVSTLLYLPPSYSGCFHIVLILKAVIHQEVLFSPVWMISPSFSPCWMRLGRR